ncbi:MAG: uracil-DNA glycosylase family protein [Gammaproteobacteria bacterium]|nr:uracil-DNA glycosylase family protein [Gammaproteobacteria bacterium]
MINVESHRVTPYIFRESVERVRACRLCDEELPLEPRPILQLDQAAKVLVVGQAPGLLVHETGIPFNDRSGERLRDWLGVDREDFYDATKFALLPMAFCYPGSGPTGDLAPPKRCASTWRKQLLELLTDIKFVLLCGRYAINWHLPHLRNQPLAFSIKSTYESQSPTLAAPHPSGRNNGWLANNPWFEQDIVPNIQSRVASAIQRDA